MPVDAARFHDPAERVSRAIALELLVRVASIRPRLSRRDDADALHDFRVAVRRLRSWMRAWRPWLRDTVSPKTERRLKRIAAATGASRDLEVQLACVDALAARADARTRPGIVALCGALSRRKRRADHALRTVLADRFEKTTAKVERALATYCVDLDHQLETFGDAAAALVAEHADAVDGALAQVRSRANVEAAHRARIAAKRLRYLLEPLAPALPAAQRLVDDLRALQDALGAMHDAHVFAETVADHLEHAGADATPGLRRVLSILRRDEREAYARAAARWLGADRERFGRRCRRLTAS